MNNLEKEFDRVAEIAAQLTLDIQKEVVDLRKKR